MIIKNLQHELFENDGENRLVYFANPFEGDTEHTGRLRSLDSRKGNPDNTDFTSLMAGISDLKRDIKELVELLYKERVGDEARARDEIATKHGFEDPDRDALAATDTLDASIIVGGENFAAQLEAYKTAFENIKKIDFPTLISGWLPEDADGNPIDLSHEIPEIGLRSFSDILSDGKVIAKDGGTAGATIPLYTKRNLQIQIPAGGDFEVRKDEPLRYYSSDVTASTGLGYLVPIWYGGQELYISVSDLELPGLAIGEPTSTGDGFEYTRPADDTKDIAEQKFTLDTNLIAGGGHNWHGIITLAEEYEMAKAGGQDAYKRALYSEAFGKFPTVATDVGSYANVISYAKEALKVDPQYGDPHYLIASALIGLGKYEEAKTSRESFNAATGEKTISVGGIARLNAKLEAHDLSLAEPVAEHGTDILALLGGNADILYSKTLRDKLVPLKEKLEHDPTQQDIYDYKRVREDLIAVKEIESIFIQQYLGVEQPTEELYPIYIAAETNGGVLSVANMDAIIKPMLGPDGQLADFSREPDLVSVTVSPMRDLIVRHVRSLVAEKINLPASEVLALMGTPDEATALFNGLYSSDSSKFSTVDADGDGIVSVSLDGNEFFIRRSSEIEQGVVAGGEEIYKEILDTITYLEKDFSPGPRGHQSDPLGKAAQDTYVQNAIQRLGDVRITDKNGLMRALKSLAYDLKALQGVEKVLYLAGDESAKKLLKPKTVKKLEELKGKYDVLLVNPSTGGNVLLEVYFAPNQEIQSEDRAAAGKKAYEELEGRVAYLQRPFDKDPLGKAARDAYVKRAIARLGDSTVANGQDLLRKLQASIDSAEGLSDEAKFTFIYSTYAKKLLRPEIARELDIIYEHGKSRREVTGNPIQLLAVIGDQTKNPVIKGGIEKFKLHLAFSKSGADKTDKPKDPLGTALAELLGKPKKTEMPPLPAIPTDATPEQKATIETERAEIFSQRREIAEKDSVAIGEWEIKNKVYGRGNHESKMAKAFAIASVSLLEQFYQEVNDMRSADKPIDKKGYGDNWKHTFRAIVGETKTEDIHLIGRPLILYNMIDRAHQVVETYKLNVLSHGRGAEWLSSMAKKQYEIRQGRASNIENIPDIDPAKPDRLEYPSGLMADMRDPEFADGQTRAYRIHTSNDPNEFPFIIRVKREHGGYKIHYGENEAVFQGGELVSKFVGMILEPALGERKKWQDIHAFRVNTTGLDDAKMGDYYEQYVGNRTSEELETEIDDQLLAIMKEISKDSKLPLPELKKLLDRPHSEIFSRVWAILTGVKKTGPGEKTLSAPEFEAAKIYLEKLDYKLHGTYEEGDPEEEAGGKGIGYLRDVAETKWHDRSAVLEDKKDKRGGRLAGKEGGHETRPRRPGAMERFKALGLRRGRMARRAKAVYYKLVDGLEKKSGGLTFKDWEFNRYGVLARNSAAMDNNLGQVFGRMVAKAERLKGALMKKGVDLRGNRGAIILPDNTVDDALLRMAALAVRGENAELPCSVAYVMGDSDRAGAAIASRGEGYASPRVRRSVYRPYV